MEREITENTPVCMVTVGQLLAFASKHKAGTAAGPEQDTGRKRVAGPEPGTAQSKYVYGLRGIRNRYGVGKNTACSWAAGLLAPAVIRDGRKIIVDTEKADKILEQWTQQQQGGQRKQPQQRTAR